jgi:hypothetical protein
MLVILGRISLTRRRIEPGERWKRVRETFNQPVTKGKSFIKGKKKKDKDGNRNCLRNLVQI